MEDEEFVELDTQETEETEVLQETEENEETEETSETPESGDNLSIDYERLESAMMQDEFTLDSDLNDLFLTDTLLLFVVFFLVVVFAPKEG